MKVTDSKAMLGKYLFKLWLTLPENEANAENIGVLPIDRLREHLCERPNASPEMFLSLMESSVEKAIGQNRKVGLFLSGGLDSSTIAILGVCPSN